jgi:hypothetical protein
MSITAFQPAGNTCLVAASSSTASTPTQVSTGSQQGMMISNPSTSPVYVAAGSSSVQAACPTTAVPCVGLCVPSGQMRPLNTPPAGWLSAATSGGAANVFATPGFYGS